MAHPDKRIITDPIGEELRDAIERAWFRASDGGSRIRSYANSGYDNFLDKLRAELRRKAQLGTWPEHNRGARELIDTIANMTPGGVDDVDDAATLNGIIELAKALQ